MRLNAKPLIPLCSCFLAWLVLGLVQAVGAMETADCQGCHADQEAVGAELFIDTTHFEGTAHAEMGCPACHTTVADTHPDDGLPQTKAECDECHAEISAEYAKSLHGGNAVCSDCHDPHAVRGPTEVSGHDMNLACASCHEPPEMVSIHDKWLPQADLHLQALPCVTCHTASENYVITFYITDTGKNKGDFVPAGAEELEKAAGGRGLPALVDTNGDSYISLAELRTFNLDSPNSSLRLQGMMTPEQVTHSFQILDNRWDCSFCHSSGAGAAQTSYIAFPKPDGTFARVAVEKGAAMDTLFGTPDFYMVGVTRSKTLNIIGLMIIAGGLVMPVGHGTLRFLTRKNRKEHK